MNTKLFKKNLSAPGFWLLLAGNGLRFGSLVENSGKVREGAVVVS